MNAHIRWDFQNALKTYNFTGPTTVVDFRNPATFGKPTDDPRTASLGGQPLMNLTIMLQFWWIEFPPLASPGAAAESLGVSSRAATWPRQQSRLPSEA